METFENYSKKVINRLRQQIEESGITQKDFAKKCNLSSSALTKILSGQQSLSLKNAYIMAQVLNMDISTLLYDGNNILEHLDEVYDSIQSGYDEISAIYNTSLVFSPQFAEFKGYLNKIDDPNDCYYFYTKPTKKEERKGYLKGYLRLVPAENATKRNRKFCRADLKLFTGKIDPTTNEPHVKKYIGEMIISRPMRSCYIILSSLDTGEINLLTLAHQFLNIEDLVCKIAAVQTVSAGGHKRPVQEKAIISRYELTDEDLDYIEGQFFMNTAKIKILASIMEDSPDYELLKNRLSDIHCEKREYYVVDENSIRASQTMDLQEIEDTVCRLRKLSDSSMYTKISTHADDLVYNYICDKVIPKKK